MNTAVLSSVSPPPRFLRSLFAAAGAAGAEIVIVGAAPAVAVVPAVLVAVTVPTIWGHAYGWFWLTWLLSQLVLWVLGAMGIAHGMSRWLGVHLLVPLLGALAVPALIIGLLVGGQDDASVDLVEAFEELVSHLRRSG